MRPSFEDACRDYVLSGHAFLHIPTNETTRLLASLRSLAADLPPDGRSVYTWSAATGWRDADGQPARNAAGVELGAPSPQTAPQQILELPEDSLFVLLDFEPYLHSRTFAYFDVVLAWLNELREVLAATSRTVIFAGQLTVPDALSDAVTELSFPLPDEGAIETAIRFVGDGHELDEAALPKLVSACRGMTEQQIEDRTALALRRFKRLDGDAANLLRHEKAAVIRRTGLLEYRDPPSGGLDRIGGWENVKQHVRLDKPCFDKAARVFGIEFPRGLLLVGISGGGKTQMSLCIASYFDLPLIQLDVGSLMSKWVGESERNMRAAIQLLEGIGPCVLQLDEIEKGFGGVGGEQDGGSAQRSFGVFLKWMGDRTSPAYVVATANNIAALPVEFRRKGRFDEVFGVNVPTSAERREIFAIHLGLRGRDAAQFDLDALVEASDSYTGADIKEVVQLGLKLAFHHGTELESHHLLTALPEVRPLSQTDPEAVSQVTAWLDAHTKPAGARLAEPSSKQRRRPVTV